MIISNCNCGKKVACDCTLSFDSYLADSVSVLSVGNLVGDTCSFDAYVIDWYRDGEKALVSGKGFDPEITAYHPFTGTGAVPVINGTWVPKVRYVVINGMRVYASPRKCDTWCDTLSGLPTINVSPIGCGLRNLSIYDIYDYRISYFTSQDFALASRAIRFDLPSDLSAVNLAFNFTAYEVADRVDFYFKDAEEPMVSWIVGTRLVTNWWQSAPYRRASASHKVAFALPEYQAGDYLIIKVTPSVLEQNTNTHWMLDLKCLDSSYVFACDYATLPMKTIESLELYHDELNCRYQLRLNLQQPFGAWSQAGHPFYWMYRYGGYGGLGHSGGGIDYLTGVGTVNIPYSKTARYRLWYLAGYNTWTAPHGPIQMTKTGNVVTFVFSDSRDYQLYYDNYQYLLGTDLFLDYSTDPTDLRHYRYIQMVNRIAPLGCGDAFTNAHLTFHITSPVVFSGGNTLTITMQNVVNGYPEEICNNATSVINGQISGIQTSINQNDFNGVSQCRPVAPIGYSVGYDGLSYPLTYSTGGHSIHAYSNKTVPCPAMQNFCDWTSPNSFWLFTFFYLRVTITTERDASYNYVKDPRENFEVYSMLSETGCYTNTPQRLLYRKTDGIEEVNNLPSF